MKKLVVLEKEDSFDSVKRRDDAASPLLFLKDNLQVVKNAQPDSVTILPTYRCNAACKECCFESNSTIKHAMNANVLLGLIRRIHEELSSVKVVVLSGGEVTLLGKDLVEAISLLTEFGIGTRIVSNGHWGSSDSSAHWWADKLRSAGLCELNLSTGEEHMEWVPIDSVAKAAYHAVGVGIRTLIVVEGKDQTRFSVEQLKKHPLISEIINSEKLRDHFMLMTNIWMPFHDNTGISNERVPKHYKGCDNIFHNFTVNPYGNIMSCCGLTMEYIPEIKIGNIENDHLQRAYTNQFRDILKLWIWLDGTQLIFDKAVERGKLNSRLVSPHPCSICAQIYKDPAIRSVVAELIKENAEDIVFRAAIKSHLYNTSQEVSQ